MSFGYLILFVHLHVNFDDDLCVLYIRLFCFSFSFQIVFFKAEEKALPFHLFRWLIICMEVCIGVVCMGATYSDLNTLKFRFLVFFSYDFSVHFFFALVQFSFTFDA